MMPNMLLEFESGAGNRFRFANMVLANIVLTSRRSFNMGQFDTFVAVQVTDEGERD